MKCIYCNNEIDEGSSFCGYCGKQQPNVKYCVKCGTELNGQMRFCPKCGFPTEEDRKETSLQNTEQIDSTKNLHSNSESLFIPTSNQLKAKVITIHGYTQWFAINPDIKVLLNGQLVGKVGKGGTLQVNIESPCQMKFECNLRSTNLNVDPSIDKDIYLSWDRISGCLLATKQDVSANNLISNNDDIDKPNIALDILSFLIPIAGLILYFVKNEKYPNSAKAYLICAICGFVLSIFLYLS